MATAETTIITTIDHGDYHIVVDHIVSNML